jgi:VCBS repeat-containing protein
VYTLNSDGSYTFTVDNAASQSLAAGQSATDTLTYEITDTAGNTATATLTTTITGTNDAAVITTAPVSVTEAHCQ